MSKKKVFMKKSSFGSLYNLIIGGWATVTTTPAELASKFSFIEGDISRFDIIGSDVYAKINNTSYNASLAFNTGDMLLMTSIIETDGYLKLLVSSQGNTNLIEVSCVGLTNPGIFYFCSNLLPSKINLPAATTLVANSFRSIHAELSYVWTLPSLTFLSSGFVQVKTKLVLPAVTSTSSTNAFFGFQGEITMENCISLGDPAVNNGLFTSIASGTIINVPSVLATINGGAPDEDLVYAAGRGCIINYL